MKGGDGREADTGKGAGEKHKGFHIAIGWGGFTLSDLSKQEQNKTKKNPKQNENKKNPKHHVKLKEQKCKHTGLQPLSLKSNEH